MIRRRLLMILLASLLSAVTTAADWGSATVAGTEVAAGQTLRFTLAGERGFEAAFIDVAIFVARGVRAGPTLCITSAIHGDEVNSSRSRSRRMPAPAGPSCQLSCHLLPRHRGGLCPPQRPDWKH